MTPRQIEFIADQRRSLTKVTSELFNWARHEPLAQQRAIGEALAHLTHAAEKLQLMESPPPAAAVLVGAGDPLDPLDTPDPFDPA